MGSFIQRHLSYANVVASLALVIALLGGSALAASYVVSSTSQVKDGAIQGTDVRNSSLTGSDVKNSSLTGSDVKDGALSGADIDPAKLGKVPVAASADKAATAVSADRAKTSDEVDGQHVERVSASIPLGTSVTVVGVDGGLQILAGCSAGGELTLAMGSTTAHALARASVVSEQSPSPAKVEVVEDADLNPGESLTLFNAQGHGTAQIAYRAADNRVSTAVIGFGELTGMQTCTVNGTLVRAG